MTTLAQMFNLTGKMASVRRFSMEKMLREEDVLQHTGEVVLLVYMMGTALNLVQEEVVNMENLLRRAAMHDIDEIHTGDIPRPTKEQVAAAMKSITLVAVSKMSNDYKNDAMLWDWQYAKEGTEGAIVALADHLAAMHRIAEELLVFGNFSILHVGLRQDAIMEKRFQAAQEALPPSCHWLLSNWLEEERSLIAKIQIAARNRGLL